MALRQCDGELHRIGAMSVGLGLGGVSGAMGRCSARVRVLLRHCGDGQRQRQQGKQAHGWGGSHAAHYLVGARRKTVALAVGLQMLVDALAGPPGGYGAVLIVARPEHDPVPALRQVARGTRLPGDTRLGEPWV